MELILIYIFVWVVWLIHFNIMNTSFMLFVDKIVTYMQYYYYGTDALIIDLCNLVWVFGRYNRNIIYKTKAMEIKEDTWTSFTNLLKKPIKDEQD